jgi:hypothetical protein
MSATITVYTVEYAAWEEGADEPERIGEDSESYTIEDFRADFGDWNEDESEWIPASVIDAAVNMLTGSVTQFWASEASSSAGEVACGDNPWYMSETYVNPYTGDMEEKSAHLSGFTADEIAEIYRRVR